MGDIPDGARSRWRGRGRATRARGVEVSVGDDLFGQLLIAPLGSALPTIGRNLHAGFQALQWTVTAYTLTLAALLLLAGSLSDRWGACRVSGAR